MSKPLKILIAALGAVVLVAVIAYAAVSSYLTPERTRRIAEQFVSQTLDHPVTIGATRLSFGFKIAISARDVSVPDTEGGGPQPMVHIGEARLNIDLFSLLRGRIAIGSVDLERIDVNARRDAGKDLNIAALTPKSVKGPELAVSISRLRIHEGKLRYQDALSGQTFEVSDIDQDVKLGRKVSIRGGLQVSMAGRDTSILHARTITISNAIDYDPRSSDITIRGLKAAVDPLTASLSGTIKESGALDIKGDITARDLSRLGDLLPDAYRMEKMGGALKSDLVIRGTTGKPQITGTCRLEAVTLMPRGMNRAIERASGSFSFTNRSLNDIDLKAELGKTNFSIKGAVTALNTRDPMLDLDASIRGDLKDLEALTDAMKGITMSGALTASMSVKGSTKSPKYSGNLAIQGAAVDGIGLGKPVSALNIRGRLQNEGIRIEECRGKIGRSDFALTATVPDLRQPVVQLNNRSGLIDLDELLPPKAAAGGKAAKPLPLTLKGSIEASRVIGLNMEFTSVSAAFTYANGVIDITNGRAHSFDGQVSLDFRYDANRPEPYRINARMSSVQAQKVGRRFLGYDRVTGGLSGGINLGGSGLDKRSVKANMSGTGSLKIVNGEFSNFVFLTKLLGWMGFADRKAVKFNDLNCGFTIVNGRASLDDWTMSSQIGNFLSRGSIGLDGTVDMQIAVTLSRSNSDIVRKYHSNWIFFTDKDDRTVIDITARGTFDSPSFALDRDRIKQRIGGSIKSEFDKKTKEFESKLKDIIKGLK